MKTVARRAGFIAKVQLIVFGGQLRNQLARSLGRIGDLTDVPDFAGSAGVGSNNPNVLLAFSVDGR